MIDSNGLFKFSGVAIPFIELFPGAVPGQVCKNHGRPRIAHCTLSYMSEQKKPLSNKQISKIIGVDESTIRKWCKDRFDLPYNKIDGQVRHSPKMIPVFQQIKSMIAGEFSTEDILLNISDAVSEVRTEHAENTPQGVDLDAVVSAVIDRIGPSLASDRDLMANAVVENMTSKYGQLSKALGKAEAVIELQQRQLTEQDHQIKLLPEKAASQASDLQAKLDQAQAENLELKERSLKLELANEGLKKDLDRCKKNSENARVAEAERNGQLSEAHAKIAHLESDLSVLENELSAERSKTIWQKMTKK